MYRGTTPTHKFCFGTTDPNIFKDILITYVQNDAIVLEKRKEDLVITSEEITSGEISSEDTASEEETVTHYHATITLTQEEANAFSGDPKNTVSIQVRAIDFDGNVMASNKMRFSVLDVLNDEVLE